MLQHMNAPSSHLHDSTVGQVVHPQARHPLHITWWPSERHFAWIFLKKNLVNTSILEKQIRKAANFQCGKSCQCVCAW